MTISNRLPIYMLVVLLLAWGAVPVLAATYTATDEASLITAINSATSSGDVIEISAGITIQLTANLPTIATNGLTINGNGATIKGGTDIRIFNMDTSSDVTINGLTIKNGNCTSGCPGANSYYGGGIYSKGPLTITNSTFSGNSSSGSGGGIYSEDTHLTIINSTFSGNSGRGGAIYNQWGTVAITNSTFSGNSGIEGGVIINGGSSGTVTIINSTLSGNSATSSDGGAIYNDGTVEIIASTLSGNSSSNSVGGAIVNYRTLTITHSTLSGNSSGAEGGAIYNEGALTVSNSTLSGNSSSIGGGAIYSYNPMTITHSTFSGNSAPSGGGLYNDGSTVTLKNTLISKGASGTNCFGTITSNGAAYNLSNDASCGADVTQVASLGLSTLGANGGPTQTIPLLVGSPAVDAALAADCPADDQRGTTRPVGAGCDIGAFEGAITLPVSDPPPTSTPSPALCSQTGFTPSTQVEVSMPSGGGGMNQCYSMLTNPAQVGITQPFTLAVEVYSFNASGSVTTGAPVQVCLQGTGTLLYRDASGQPRVTVSLPSFTKDGFTCGIIPNAGTVILIPGAPAPTATSPATPLSSCRVTTANIVNLRAAPDINSAILTQVPYQTVLNASARSGGWLQVVVGSQQGWVSESYVRLGRTCK